MRLIKKIKKHFRKKKMLKKHLVSSIPNINLYNKDLKTIVFLANAIPKHDVDSGSNRFKEIITSFANSNYNCILCVENTFEIDKYINYYIDLGVIIYIETNIHKNYLCFLKSIAQIDFIWYNGPKNLNFYVKVLKQSFPNSLGIFDMIDIHFLRYQRSIELDPHRISLRKNFRKYFKIETQLAKNADIIVAISEKEKQFMLQYLPNKKIIVVSNIHYHTINRNEIPTFEQRNNLLFIGSSHEPNIDAVYYLHNEIMPLVWKQLPELIVTVIGNVKDQIKSKLDPRFKMLGFVENIDDYFLKSKLMVAPLRVGAGVKGKIGQAFEYYLPVITTPIGAEGMFLENEKNAFIAKNAEDFSKQIITLYNNKEIWTKFSHNSTESLYPFSKEHLIENIKDLK